MELIKVREGKYKGKHGEDQVECQTVRECGSLLQVLLFIFIHLFTRAYIVWAITPPFLPPPPSPNHHPLLPGRICSALFSNFVEEKT
jgi:hypothetical protein